MADPRAVFRLGLAPLVLLACNLFAGAPLPYLGATLAVTLLMPGGPRPPLKMLAGAVVLVLGISWALARGFGALADSPASVWMALLALATACFAKLAVAPQNVPALLALLVSVVVTALIQAEPSLTGPLPWIMGWAASQAVVATLLAHAILPSRGPGFRPPPPRAAPASPGLVALAKAVAMVAALGVCAAAGQASGVLVAITLSNMLRLPEDAAAHRFGRWLVFANLAALLLVLPVVAVAILRPENIAVIPLILAFGLWIAAGQGRMDWRGMLTLLGLPVFVLVLGQTLPDIDTNALADMADRMMYLGISVLYGGAVLILLHRGGTRATA